MHSGRIFGQSQHLALQSAIDHFSKGRDVRIRPRKLKEDWPTFHKKYIEMWQRRYDYLPTCEPFLAPELATTPDYMDWFRHNGKSYLLATLERSRQRRRRRPRRGPINPSSGEDATAGSTSTSSALKDSIVVQPLGQYGSFIFGSNLVFLLQA
ncbi:hypothetical protein Gotri_026329 [Gossypium trilobum]|uniref:Aminotransferase-like plant mobile domain-containing protein n=1 Tax=Gossypium trilobum TaxID=34281 RepID=A0A7J9FWT5_9ROSI|nr:hypothetical protein [Gossypium trilobum]